MRWSLARIPLSERARLSSPTFRRASSHMGCRQQSERRRSQMFRVNQCTDLALFGGAPAFDEQLHVGRPNMGDRRRLVARLDDILDRRWFTNDGWYVQEFERAIAEMVGVRHCIAMCNG